MIASEKTPQGHQLLIKPNQSLTWRGNLYLLASLGGITFLIAVMFTLLGAWVILPFAGIEIAALATALYVVNWRVNFRELIRFEKDMVVIEKGHFAPKWRWRFKKQYLKINVEPEKHPWEGPSITLYCSESHAHVPLGRFLNKEDSEQLIVSLQALQLPVASYAKEDQRPF